MFYTLTRGLGQRPIIIVSDGRGAPEGLMNLAVRSFKKFACVAAPSLEATVDLAWIEYGLDIIDDTFVMSERFERKIFELLMSHREDDRIIIGVEFLS